MKAQETNGKKTTKLSKPRSNNSRPIQIGDRSIAGLYFQ